MKFNVGKSKLMPIGTKNIFSKNMLINLASVLEAGICTRNSLTLRALESQEVNIPSK